MRIAFLIFFSALSFQAFSEVKQFTLENGLKIIVKEDHRAPIAVSMIWYNVGSADERGGLTGLSHALEHMMFKGTPTHSTGTFSKLIAGIGGQENAFTNFDYTAYFEKVPASELPLVFELEADRMQNLILDETEFKKEINVIKEERRLRTEDNPQALTLERYLATAHLTTPYHHPVIGWMSDLNQMQLNELKNWYQSFYSPNNATLVVVGDVDSTWVFQLASHYFANITKKTNYVRQMQLEPRPLGMKKIEVHTPAQLPLLIFGYTVPSAKSAKKEWEPYALEVVAGILDAGESGRFTKNLIRQSHIASAVDASYNLYSRFQTQFLIYAIPSQTNTVEQLKKSILQELNRLKNELVSSEELDRIKTQLIAQKTFEKDSIFGQAMELGLIETIGLGVSIADRYPEKIKQVTPEQIQQVVNRYFSTVNETEALLIPTSKEENT